MFAPVVPCRSYSEITRASALIRECITSMIYLACRYSDCTQMKRHQSVRCSTHALHCVCSTCLLPLLFQGPLGRYRQVGAHHLICHDCARCPRQRHEPVKHHLLAGHQPEGTAWQRPIRNMKGGRGGELNAGVTSAYVPQLVLFLAQATV